MGARHTFDPKSAYVVKMIAVDVGVHPEQTPHDRLDCVAEVSWKGNPYMEKWQMKKQTGQMDRDHRRCQWGCVRIKDKDAGMYRSCWGRWLRHLGCFAPNS